MRFPGGKSITRIALIALATLDCFSTPAFSQSDAGCITEKCHADIASKKWVHGPVGAFICTVCHNEVAVKRLDGKKWLSITHEYDLSAVNFYVLIFGKIESKYYVPIFAKYRFASEAQWNMLSLNDEEIRALVNLKFIYSHQDYSPYHIMAMKDFGKDFVRISNQIAVAKVEERKREMAQKSQQQKME